MRRRIDPEIVGRVLELRHQGMGMVKIGEEVGVGSKVVEYILQQPRQIGCLSLPPLWPL